MDCCKVDGDLSRSWSPVWKMRDVSVQILTCPFIPFYSLSFAYSCFPGRGLRRSVTPGLTAPPPSDGKALPLSQLSTAPLRLHHPHISRSHRGRTQPPCCAAARLFAFLRPCMSVCVYVHVWEVITLMLIWSFALSGHSGCIVLDLLIAGSEMLLLLFHMDRYSAKRRRWGGGGGGTGKGQTIVMDQRSKIVSVMMEKQLEKKKAHENSGSSFALPEASRQFVFDCVWDEDGFSKCLIIRLVLFLCPNPICWSKWSVWKEAVKNGRFIPVDLKSVHALSFFIRLLQHPQINSKRPTCALFFAV